MKKKIEYSRDSLSDLFDIFLYIEQYNPSSAKRIMDEIEEDILQLIRFSIKWNYTKNNTSCRPRIPNTYNKKIFSFLYNY